MKNRVILTIWLLYIAAFSNFVMELMSLDNSLNSFILLLLDAGIVYLGLFAIGRDKTNIWFLSTIIIITFFNYISHEYSFVSYINGLREIINIVLIFMFLENLSRSPYQIVFWNKFKKFMKVFLILQIPIALYQFVLYGAGDEVGGSMGKGNSGVLTLLAVMMVFLIIKDEKTRYGIKAYYNSLFLIPLFLNETKISFLLIPLMFLFLVDIKRFIPALVSICFGVLFFITLNTYYSNKGRTSENPFEEIFSEDYLDNYLLGEAQGTGDVPRLTKIILASELINRNTVDFLLGIETGAFRGGNVIEQSSFAKKYNWLLLGSRPYIFYLLITGGWSLFLLFIVFIYKKLFSKKKLNYDTRFIYLLTSIFIIMLFYNDALRSQIFILVFSYFILIGNGQFNIKKDSIKRIQNKNKSYLHSHGGFFNIHYNK